MKVCYITHLPNLTGANRSLLDMLDGIDKGIVTPIVLLNSHGPIEKELKKRNIEYEIAFYSPSTNSDNIIKNFGKMFLNTACMNRLAVKSIKKVLQKKKIELVHNNSYLVGAGMEAAYELKLPYICHIREFLWEDHHRKFFHEERQQILMQNASQVIAITKAVKNKFQEKTEKEIMVLLDGIKIEEYLLPYRRIYEKDRIDILLAGRIAPGKGQIEAIKAIELLHQNGYNKLHLHIIGGIGDEEYNKKIHQYVQFHKLEFIKFYQFIHDLKQIRLKCDIGLTCSRAEALGRVTIENMLSSMLVIVGNSAGSQEIIRNGETGYFYKTGSYQDLAEVLKYALENPIKCNQIVLNGYEEAKEKYNYITYAEKITKLYQQIYFERS